MSSIDALLVGGSYPRADDDEFSRMMGFLTEREKKNKEQASGGETVKVLPPAEVAALPAVGDTAGGGEIEKGPGGGGDGDMPGGGVSH